MNPPKIQSESGTFPTARSSSSATEPENAPMSSSTRTRISASAILRPHPCSPLPLPPSAQETSRMSRTSNRSTSRSLSLPSARRNFSDRPPCRFFFFYVFNFLSRAKDTFSHFGPKLAGGVRRKTLVPGAREIRPRWTKLFLEAAN